MKKKIKSAVISIVVIAVLLLAILIGVKNGTLDKLTKEMPTLATNQAETEKATVNARNNSTESKPYDGIEVAEYGEEFVITGQTVLNVWVYLPSLFNDFNPQFINLFFIILGGISFVLTKQLNMFLYICLLTSLFQCIFELIKNNA